MAPVLDPSSIYWFTDADEFAEASRDKVGGGYVYSRWANPTVDAFEAAVADLERTEGAEAFASGMAAITSICLAACSAGDRVVSARQLYGGTHELFTSLLPRYGITAELFDVNDLDGIEGALEGAKLLFCETIGNPRIEIADVPTLASLAGSAGVPLVVDNTFASPILCRPVELGATLSVHSATKFIGGHHDLLGGIVCGGRDALEPVAALNREFGATLSPFNAWLALRGLVTLPLRIERACSSALSVAEYLSDHPKIDRVYYPGLDGDPSKPLAEKLLSGAGGGTLGFDVAGGLEPAARFQGRLRLTRPAASLGGVHSLIVHAASITHTQLSAEQLEDAGIAEGFCRMSVGLEDPEDIIEDLGRALGDAA